MRQSTHAVNPKNDNSDAPPCNIKELYDAILARKLFDGNYQQSNKLAIKTIFEQFLQGSPMVNFSCEAAKTYYAELIRWRDSETAAEVPSVGVKSHQTLSNNLNTPTQEVKQQSAADRQTTTDDRITEKSRHNTKYDGVQHSTQQLTVVSTVDQAKSAATPKSQTTTTTSTQPPMPTGPNVAQTKPQGPQSVNFAASAAIEANVKHVKTVQTPTASPHTNVNSVNDQTVQPINPKIQSTTPPQQDREELPNVVKTAAVSSVAVETNTKASIEKVDKTPGAEQVKQEAAQTGVVSITLQNAGQQSKIAESSVQTKVPNAASHTTTNQNQHAENASRKESPDAVQPSLTQPVQQLQHQQPPVSTSQTVKTDQKTTEKANPNVQNVPSVQGEPKQQAPVSTSQTVKTDQKTTEKANPNVQNVPSVQGEPNQQPPSVIDNVKQQKLTKEQKQQDTGNVTAVASQPAGVQQQQTPQSVKSSNQASQTAVVSEVGKNVQDQRSVNQQSENEKKLSTKQPAIDTSKQIVQVQAAGALPQEPVTGATPVLPPSPEMKLSNINAPSKVISAAEVDAAAQPNNNQQKQDKQIIPNPASDQNKAAAAADKTPSPAAIQSTHGPAQTIASGAEAAAANKIKTTSEKIKTEQSTANNTHDGAAGMIIDHGKITQQQGQKTNKVERAHQQPSVQAIRESLKENASVPIQEAAAVKTASKTSDSSNLPTQTVAVPQAETAKMSAQAVDAEKLTLEKQVLAAENLKNAKTAVKVSISAEVTSQQRSSDGNVISEHVVTNKAVHVSTGSFGITNISARYAVVDLCKPNREQTAISCYFYTITRFVCFPNIVDVSNAKTIEKVANAAGSAVNNRSKVTPAAVKQSVINATKNTDSKAKILANSPNKVSDEQAVSLGSSDPRVQSTKVDNLSNSETHQVAPPSVSSTSTDLATEKRAEVGSQQAAQQLQAIELQMLKLENQLLSASMMRRDDDTTHARLENDILKLQNELLRLSQLLQQTRVDNEMLRQQQANLTAMTAMTSELIAFGRGGTDHEASGYGAIAEIVQNQTKLVDEVERLQERCSHLERENAALVDRLLLQTETMNSVLLRLNVIGDEQRRQEAEMAQIHNRHRQQQTNSRDCYALYTNGVASNGPQTVRLSQFGLALVYCDMLNGGWTVIQRRINGTVDFYRPWTDYKQGFGDVAGEHWLGNDIIHAVTNLDEPYSLRIDLTDWNQITRSVFYETFRVGSESDGYKLLVDGYREQTPPSGDSKQGTASMAGDSLLKHSGNRFSTLDVDNDLVVNQYGHGSCARRFYGAWWYYSCYMSNLNGRYYHNGGNVDDVALDGVAWKSWTGSKYSLKTVEMKIRPRRAGLW